MGHNLLPTNSKIKSVNPGCSSSCSRSNGNEETLIHALRDCIKSREVLMNEGFDNRLLSDEWHTGIDWLEGVMKFLDSKVFECLTMVLWNIWNSRNNNVFKGVVEDSRRVWDSALTFCNDFRIHNLNQGALISRVARQSHWEKPPEGVLIINFNVAWENRSIGIGFLARDDDGFVHGGGEVFKEDVACFAWGGSEWFHAKHHVG